ncbi:WD40-repeat-containing domain protein [Hyaloraphidium curvatum]|nr:WD40-repeat-containing domain protein [Hyaloraphidium curvatum]
MQRPEPITSFFSPEGEWRLRDELRYDLSPNTFIGSSVSMVTLAAPGGSGSLSSGTDGADVDPAQFGQLSKFGTSLSGSKANSPNPSASGTSAGRFTEVPIQSDPGSGDRGYMVFFKDSPPSLQRRKPLQLGRPGSSGGKTGSSSGTPSGGASATPPANSVPFSQFVSKVVAHEALPRLILQPTPSPAASAVPPTYLFANIGKVILWLDFVARSEGQRIGDPLACIYMKEAYPTCHDVNVITRDNLDICVGFSTGEILCLSPISGRYSRHNRGSILPPGAGVTCIKWMPGSETQFMAGYDDGSVVVWDKEREDPAPDFFPKDDIAQRMAALAKETQGQQGPGTSPYNTVFWTFKALKGTGPAVFVPPQSAGPKAQAPAPAMAALNPVVYYKVSKRAITAISFSPDCQHVGITSMDGSLKIVDYVNERLSDTFPSYFGGITTLSWSPDGKFLLTGGQDDLIEVLSLPLRRVVARAQGHQSWVTSVQFDRWRCTDRVYRFGSVGEDARLCLWDFGMHSLHRPRGTMKKVRGGEQAESKHEIVHPVIPRGEVAVIYPVVSKVLHNDPMCSLQFQETALVTSCRQGALKIWQRPLEP